MDSSHRLAIVMLLLVLVAPPLTFALSALELEERQQRIEEIERTIEESKTPDDVFIDIRALRAEGEEEMRLAERTLARLGQEKRQVRLALAQRKKAIEQFREQYGVDPSSEAELSRFIASQRDDASEMLSRYARVQYQMQPLTSQYGRSVLSKVLGFSLADQVDDNLRFQALSRLRMHLIASLMSMIDFPDEVKALQTDHSDLLDSYHASLDDLDEARKKIRLSNNQLAQIQSIDTAVQQRIRLMQSQLAEFDERIRERAEHKLIQMGLRGDRSRYATPRFQWPVVGRLTATFFDDAYRAFFGIPHRAIDIAQKQGSPVHAAADGIVYYNQNGGARGYSYILIGHRSGYATLYGHISQIHVSRGDDIRRGQVIGLSGGMPGTPGSGPMTTGPHLHFEVIQDGSHINPLSILP